MNILSLSELQAGLGDPAGPVLLDVRLPEDFVAGHLPKAKHACVFQVDFPDVVKGVVPDPDRSVVVYGADEKSHESRMAAEKLRRFGYSKCRDFRGGLAAWREAGLEVEGTGAIETAPAPLHGAVDIDLGESRVVWVGRNLLNRHWGTVALSGGRLVFAGGGLIGGDFTIDLRQIQCHDLAGTPLHAVLIAHLQSDDFFDVENFPEARFVITTAPPVEPVTPGGLNLKVTGELTLRGQTHPLTFWASTGRTPEGRPAAQATLTLDRTQWGVLYGSGKLFRRLAAHMVNDHIELQLRIVGREGGTAVPACPATATSANAPQRRHSS